MVNGKPKVKDKDKGKGQADCIDYSISSSSSSSSSFSSSCCCWSSGLPHEILASILNRLQLPDYFRCRAVCKSWNSLLASSPIPPHLFHPLLMVPRITTTAQEEDDGETETIGEGGVCSLYSLSHPLQGPFRINISLPFGRWTRCISSSNGWLMVTDGLANLHMLDPISGVHIPLPPVTTFASVNPIYSSSLGTATDITGYIFRIFPETLSEEFTPLDFCKIFFHKAIVGWSDTSPPTYTVMAIFGGDEFFLAFVRQGDTAWTSLQPKLADSEVFDDIIYHKGCFYALIADGTVRTYDLSGPVPVATMVIIHTWNELRDNEKYLVQASGDLFVILRIMDDVVGQLYRTIAFQVYKMVNGDGCGGGGCKWVQVQTLGDHSFFVGNNESFSLSIQGCPGVKGNCIFFTDHYCRDKDVGVFNFDDGSFTFYYPHECGLIRPQPIWFVPNLLNYCSGNSKFMNK